VRLLLFTAEWCAPCKQLKPIVRELAEEYSLELQEVDVDADGSLVRKFDVKSIPCLVFLGRNGEVVDMLHGVKPKHFIRQIIERVKHA
jgi:thioredoxin-like negative regulator of GroEL